MSKHGKKYKKAAEHGTHREIVSIKDGIDKVKALAFAGFDEAVDVSVNLGIDASKGDQTVRGAAVLPHGRGKKVKILVFAKGDHAEKAKQAGADYVGAEDLIEKVSKGWIDFDHTIATPDMMAAVGKLARVLGPRGLLPNKKVGTVTFDVDQVVQELKKGKAFFRNDKGGIVHFSIGKVSFDSQKLHDNLTAFVKALLAAKPATAKGKFVQKMALSSTMGVGIHVNPDELARS